MKTLNTLVQPTTHTPRFGWLAASDRCPNEKRWSIGPEVRQIPVRGVASKRFTVPVTKPPGESV